MSTIINSTPCTLITGFLGSGKTTLINQLLTFKPSAERWALLINEFGQIGIDASLIEQTIDDTSLAIREVSGGCICCTSQLPLQIALSRLLAEHHPHRMLIEPTGLAHPKALLKQLCEPHWHTSLSMRSVIGVLSALQWQQPKYREHQGYQAHARDADVLVVNRSEQLSAVERQQLSHWIQSLNPHAQVLWMPPLDGQQNTGSNDTGSKMATKEEPSEFLQALAMSLIQPSQRLKQLALQSRQQSRIALRSPLLGKSAASIMSNSGIASSAATNPVHQDDSPSNLTGSTSEPLLPYRYHDHQQGMMVGGWRLPAEWQFDAQSLQNWLLSLPDWQRIKGVVNTNEGWLTLNLTPDSLSINTTEAHADNRLEIILTNRSIEEKDNATDVKHQNTDANNDTYKLDPPFTQQWQEWDEILMSLLLQEIP